MNAPKLAELALNAILKGIFEGIGFAAGVIAALAALGLIL